MRELGIIQSEEVAAVAGTTPDVVERLAQDRPHLFEPLPGRSRTWRLIPTRTEPDDAAPPDLPLAEKLTRAAEELVQPIECGLVHDEHARAVMLRTAAQRVELARAASRGAALSLEKRLVRLERRLDVFRGQAAAPPPLIGSLRDWTRRIRPQSNSGEAPTFDFDASRRHARGRRSHPVAVFEPALHAIETRLPDSPRRIDLVPTLDGEIRTAALRGDVFDVLSLACLAAVCGLGAVSDAILAAITTPAFAAATDPGGRRIVYAALSNLARPGSVHVECAAEACLYLLRRLQPGRDEMELLAPASLQADRPDWVAIFTLISEWLRWEGEQDHEAPQWPQTAVPRLSAVARNIGCALDARGFRPIERILRKLADDQRGVILVHHLCYAGNEAIELKPRRPRTDIDPNEADGQVAQSGAVEALARAPVAQLTNPGWIRAEIPFKLPPSDVTRAIAFMRTQQSRALVATPFTERRRAWAAAATSRAAS